MTTNVRLKYTNRIKEPCVAGFTLIMLDPKWNIVDEQTHFGLDCMEEFFLSEEGLSLQVVEKVQNIFTPLTTTDDMR